MKDLYSFHRDEKDLEDYYQRALEAYQKVFKRCGLDSIVTEASGGSFSKYSHEFHVLTKNGEDTIFYCGKCFYAQNKEIAEYKEEDKCPKCGGEFRAGKSIEVGNIFQLKTKYYEPFKLEYVDENSQIKPVIMGCYGIGPSRVMGSVVEVYHDDRGIIWPENVAPFQVHLLQIGESSAVVKNTQKVYDKLLKEGFEVLFDDRKVSAGEKFADADLLGIPYRIVVSEKTKDKIEIKKRSQAKGSLDVLDNFIKQIKNK